MTTSYIDVTATDVLAFLGTHEAGQDVAQVTAVIHVALAMVKGYTRGRGFTGNQVEEDLAPVVTSCAARLYRNPTLDRVQTAGPFTQQPGTFHGWTLPELSILNNYRIKAQ